MLLRRNPGVRATQLASLAKVSPATMVRMLKEVGASVIRIGNTSSLAAPSSATARCALACATPYPQSTPARICHARPHALDHIKEYP